MAEEKPDNKSAEPQEPQQEIPKKGKNKLIIIIAIVTLVLSASSFLAYIMLIDGKGKAGEGYKKDSEKAALLSLEPFVLNLTEQGKYLKVSMQFEFSDASYQPLVADKIPQLRDAIIILISSKSSESVSSPEGKFQLKDELILRANQAVGKDAFKNLYFTEFVMQ